jgi:hypothetical protein
MDDDLLRHDPPRGHETRDLSIRAIAVFFCSLTLLIIVVAIAMKWTFDAFVARDRARDPPPSPLEASLPELPPEPRLEVKPSLGIAELRRSEEAALGGYAWIDEKAGTVRIPIERAMELVLERGLPVRKP